MIAALLLGRKGSVGFPGKNLHPILGRPLSWYPMNAAKQARTVDRVFLSTDDARIRRLVDDLPLAVCEAARRRELMATLIARRDAHAAEHALCELEPVRAVHLDRELIARDVAAAVEIEPHLARDADLVPRWRRLAASHGAQRERCAAIDEVRGEAAPLVRERGALRIDAGRADELDLTERLVRRPHPHLLIGPCASTCGRRKVASGCALSALTVIVKVPACS